MAGAVAHNFNNLLQIVMGGGQVALKHLESGNTAQMRHEIEQMVRACDLGAETVKRLQDFSKVRSETTASDYAVFALSHTMRQVVEMTRPWWKINPEKDGVTISLATDLAEGCLVRGKESALFEVGVNLMKNATEACPKGGKIDVRVFADEDHVIFQVQDDGVGIDEASLGKVFQPFWTTKGFQGTGMGLASFYGIVTRHGGNISAESIEGRGTTFTVTLPKARSQAHVPTQTVSRILDVNLRILVVDDVDTLLKTIEDGLALYGQEVFTASSGNEALAIFNEKTVDVVICDLGMEGMNGWEVSRAIKEICLQKRIPKPPFILMTGWGGQLSNQVQLNPAWTRQFPSHYQFSRYWKWCKKWLTLMNKESLVGWHAEMAMKRCLEMLGALAQVLNCATRLPWLFSSRAENRPDHLTAPKNRCIRIGRIIQSIGKDDSWKRYLHGHWS